MRIHEFHSLQLVMLTDFAIEWLYLKRLTSTLLGGLHHVCSPYSAQLRCKLIVIAVKQVSTLLARKFSKLFSAQNSFSWCKSCFSHLFMAACRAHICLESFINSIKLYVLRQKVWLKSNSQSFYVKLDCSWNANTWICSVGSIHITTSNID